MPVRFRNLATKRQQQCPLLILQLQFCIGSHGCVILDSQYVLANYKTEPCKRPPRLCRQGYACPQYHNSKDRRRNPHIYKYRSTPCPQVKQHDEWGDPAVCDQGDECQYCHSRTEQQFYPEVSVSIASTITSWVLC